MNLFRYTAYAQEIIFGAGSLDRLPEAAEKHGWRRLLLCTGRSLTANGTTDAVCRVLADRPVVIYDTASPHVPEAQVAETLELALKHDVDAVIGLGGGSPIGLAKALSLALEAKRTSKDTARSSHPTEQPLVPTVAIPTTYAGSEMTPTY